jgi:endonuclease YncB( thermonuclease family)
LSPANRLLACAALLLPSMSAAADTLTGRATVIDGDTLEIQSQRIRLLDIDAPESQQICSRVEGNQVTVGWPCGQRAALALPDWISQALVICEATRKDKYQQWLGHCLAGGQNVALWLASRGWAVPYRDCRCEAIRNVSEQARLLGRGLWSGTFVMPWD